jgi:hypothetical protein
MNKVRRVLVVSQRQSTRLFYAFESQFYYYLNHTGHNTAPPIYTVCAGSLG